MFEENCFFSRGAPALRQSSARDPGPGGQGGSSHAPERRCIRQQPPVGKGALAARQSRAYIPCPRWAGDSSHVSERRSCPRHPVGRGSSSSAPQLRARPRPLDTFLESTYPEMQRKHIPRVNEYQS